MGGTVLIYGGSGAIGGATGAKLRERGYALHLAGRDAAKLAAAAGRLGARSSVADVTDPDSFARVAAEAGPLAGLVYAVGTINLKPLSRLTPEDYLRDFQVNALGAALAVKASAGALKEGRGAVVLFSSIAASQGFGSHASIAMAKGAVEGLVLTLAAELAPAVRVNAVAPSLTRTPLAAGLTKPGPMAEAIAAMHALPRLGEAEDIAGAAAFLVSEEAAWITGQVLRVDGGRSRVRTKG